MVAWLAAWWFWWFSVFDGLEVLVGLLCFWWFVALVIGWFLEIGGLLFLWWFGECWWFTVQQRKINIPATTYCGEFSEPMILSANHGRTQQTRTRWFWKYDIIDDMFPYTGAFVARPIVEKISLENSAF